MLDDEVQSMTNIKVIGIGGGGGGNRNFNRGGSSSDYRFKVRYDDYEEKAYINMRRAEDGWNFLGTYNFKADTIEVVLTNESAQQTITADAVKIVKR